MLQIVEATTANGLCTLRVRALPLPSQVASVLDNNADLLRRLFDAPSAAAPLTEAHGLSSQGSAPSSPHQQRQAAQGDVPSLEGLRLSESGGVERPGLDGSWMLLNHPSGSSSANKSSANGTHSEQTAAAQPPAQSEQQPQEQGQHAPSGSGQQESGQENDSGGVGSAAETSNREDGLMAAEGTAKDVETFRGRLRAAADEAGGSAEALLQRAWLLGPKQVRIRICCLSSSDVLQCLQLLISAVARKHIFCLRRQGMLC